MIFLANILHPDLVSTREIVMVPRKFRVDISPCASRKPGSKESGEPKNRRHHCRQIATNNRCYNDKSRYRAVRGAIHPIAEIAAVRSPAQN